MPDPSRPPCPSWCSSEHRAALPTQVYVHHGGALTSFPYFHAVVSIGATWSELIGGPTLSRPTIAIGRLGADGDTFVHLAPEDAAALARILGALKPEDLPRFAFALNHAATELRGGPQ